ncbi:hypothetical protein [Klebsiella pneumoniae]|nr:hypothetical protein [Klebsiella pneumoniae]
MSNTNANFEMTGILLGQEARKRITMKTTRTARWDITPRGNTGGSGHR